MRRKALLFLALFLAGLALAVGGCGSDENGGGGGGGGTTSEQTTTDEGYGY